MGSVGKSAEGSTDLGGGSTQRETGDEETGRHDDAEESGVDGRAEREKNLIGFVRQNNVERAQRRPYA